MGFPDVREVTGSIPVVHSFFFSLSLARFIMINSLFNYHNTILFNRPADTRGTVRKIR